jgi:hypothetical protein
MSPAEGVRDDMSAPGESAAAPAILAMKSRRRILDPCADYRQPSAVRAALELDEIREPTTDWRCHCKVADPRTYRKERT